MLSEIESSTTDELAEELDELMNKHMEIYPQEWKKVLPWDLKQGQG